MSWNTEPGSLLAPQPNLTVIIPAFDRPGTLSMLLQAHCLQTLPFTEFEVVVVLDGPNERVESVLRSASLPFSLRWFVRPHKGETAARNFAIGKARGDIIVGIDDDIIPSPEFLARHMDWHRVREDVVVLGVCEIHPDSTEKFLAETFNWTKTHYEHGITPGYEADHGDLSDHNFSVKKKHLIAAGGWDESLEGYGGIDDLELGYRLRKMGILFKYEPLALAYHYYVKSLDSQLEHSRVSGRAQLYYFQKHPERLCDLRFPALVLQQRSKAWGLRTAKYVPEFLFSLIRNRIAPRFKAWRPKGKARIRRTLVRVTSAMFFGRGMWDYGAQMETACRQLRIVVPFLRYKGARSTGTPANDILISQIELHLQFFKKWGYCAISIRDYIEWQTSLKNLPAKPVVLTFDVCDWESCHRLAALLERYRMNAAFFFPVPGATVGIPSSKHAGGPQTTVAQEASGTASAAMEFGLALSMDTLQTPLQGSSAEEFLRDSAKAMEEMTGRKIRLLAYQACDNARDLWSSIAQAGFEAACILESGPNGFGRDRFALRRNTVAPDASPRQLHRALRRSG